MAVEMLQLEELLANRVNKAVPSHHNQEGRRLEPHPQRWEMTESDGWLGHDSASLRERWKGVSDFLRKSKFQFTQTPIAGDMILS